MRDRPKVLPKVIAGNRRTVAQRHEDQDTMTKVMRMIGDDLSGFLGGIGKRGVGAILPIPGKYKITPEQAIARVRSILSARPRPWRAHLARERRRALGRQGRRKHEGS